MDGINHRKGETEMCMRRGGNCSTGWRQRGMDKRRRWAIEKKSFEELWMAVMREKDGLKIWVCVCTPASFEQTPSIHLWQTKNCQAYPQTMITSSVLYESQLMLIHLIWVLDGTKKWLFKDLKAVLYTRRTESLYPVLCNFVHNVLILMS